MPSPNTVFASINGTLIELHSLFIYLLVFFGVAVGFLTMAVDVVPPWHQASIRKTTRWLFGLMMVLLTLSSIGAKENIRNVVVGAALLASVVLLLWYAAYTYTHQSPANNVHTNTLR